MKIKTITCHHVYNYGAALQAYALQTFLQQQGHDVQIIDYVRPGANANFKKGMTEIPKSSRLYWLGSKSNLITRLYCVWKNRNSNTSIKRCEAFNRFQADYFHLTRRYSSIEDLRQDAPDADVYIAGSDQIWNPLLANGKDLSFYLDFGSPKTKRISYAASFSITADAISDEHAAFVHSFLNKFDSISVREHTGLSILTKVGVKGEEVLDPVFLLSIDEWKNTIAPTPLVKDKYILVYHLFSSSSGLKEYVIDQRRKTGFKVVCINDKTTRPYADIQFNDAGPLDFLNLILNAEMVVADSFHATAFSIIFQKDFHVFYNRPNISRIADLLHNLELDDRLNNSNSTRIKWREKSNLLALLIQQSKAFLLSNIDK